MIYRVGIATSANTAEADKQKTEIKLSKGIIHKVEIVFPSGCQGYLHVTMNHGLHQIWPSTADEDFASDNEPISFNEFYELKYSPFTLTVFTWNLDDSYSHTAIIRIGLLPRASFAPWQTGWEERTIE